FTRSLTTSPSGGCGPNNTMGADPYLRAPSAITTVSYSGGKRCSDQTSRSVAATWRKLGQETRRLSGKLARRVWARFLAQHHLGERTWLNNVMPECGPVGWVVAKLTKLTSADVASPIRLTVARATRFCVKASQRTFTGAVPCDRRVPKGDRWLYGAGPGQKAVLVTISFIARRAVSSDNSWYQGALKDPGNHGSDGLGTDQNIRIGQRITLSTFLGTNLKGTYQGIMTFVQNTGPHGQDRFGAGLLLGRHGIRPRKGTLVVGRFSFKLPLKH
ncbi:MAG TPA: hypothetical protein VG293_05965, partial [Solirubrobacteraceae bacterium]|nr:hypothetical protein [Solirubrobacteraceae bacterium]